MDQILIIVATSLFMVYTLYCVLGPTGPGSIVPQNPSLLVLSTPVAFYLIVRYIYLTYAEPEKARKTEKAFFDRGLIIGGILLVAIVAIAIYLDVGKWVNFITRLGV